MANAVFVIDEVHKCLYSGTQRTGATLELAKAARETIALTGTPVLNAGSGKLLIPYMELVVPFFVGPRNFIVAANAMVAYRVDTGVGRREVTVDPWHGDAKVKEAEQTGDTGKQKQQQQQQRRRQQQQHDKCLDEGDLASAVKICYDVCTPVMVQETIARAKEGVLLVANNKTHQQELARALVKFQDRRSVITAGDTNSASASAGVAAVATAVAGPLRVFCMAKDAEGFPRGSPTVQVVVGSDIHLTTQTVREGTEQAFHVVVVRQDQCEGYTVTALGAMVASVYFSNQATREQMRGRIDRLTQHRLESKGLYVEYVTVSCGILVNIAAHYEKAAMLSKALSGKGVSKKDLQKLLKCNPK
jgi:CO dehydrogenase/acetyl-CoA synthase epsilon subunit